MRRVRLLVMLPVAVMAGLVGVGFGPGSQSRSDPHSPWVNRDLGTVLAGKTTDLAARACPAGSTAAVIGGKRVCLRLEVGASCASSREALYRRHGFSCAAGRLVRPWLIHNLATFDAKLEPTGIRINAQGLVIASDQKNRHPPFVWENGVLSSLGSTVGQATDLNDTGQIVGWHYTTGANIRAFLWQNGQLTDLPSLGGSEDHAYAINAHEEIVGDSQTPAGDRHAVAWDNGAIRDLGTLGNGGASASDINDRGQIVGAADGGSAIGTRAVLWQNGAITDLGVDRAYASAINNSGQIIGGITADVSTSAVLWDNEMLRFIDRAPTWDYDWAENSFAAINDRGQIVGWEANESDDGHDHYYVVSQAARWLDGKRRVIPALSGDQAYAVAINNRGQVVGRSTYDAGPPNASHAFVWQSGTMTDLSTLGGRMSSADALNERGEIVGTSTTKDGRTHLVLWTPRPS